MSNRHSGAGRNPEKHSLDPGLRRGDDWVVVCRLNDIVPNTGVCALVSGRQIAIFRLDDNSLYALDNYDPFSRANVLSRGIVGDVKGELVVASPVYKQHFGLASGLCLEDAAVRVAVFPVRLEDEHVWVNVTRDEEPLPPPQAH
jgi:NAD(P)H-dependent nitrite reductase small subunit